MQQHKTSDRLTKLLLANQGLINQQMQFVLSQSATLKAEHFFPLYLVTAQQVLDQYDEESEEKLNELVMTLFNEFVILFSGRYIGTDGRFPELTDSTGKLISVFKDLFLFNSKDFLAISVNSILRLSRSGINVEKVVEHICKTKPQTIREYGIIILTSAWLNGLSEYRMEALSKLPEISLANISSLFTFDRSKLTENTLKSAIEGMKKNPWINFDTAINNSGKMELIVHWVGGFTGFDGYFLEPPEIKISNSEIILYDSTNQYVLHADVYGVRLVRSQSDNTEKGTSSGVFHCTEHAVIECGEKVLKIQNKGMLRSASQVATTLAVSFERSFKVAVIGAGKI